MSGAWLCLHIWDHFLFAHDKAFLQEYWDIIRGSVEFFLDFLVDHDGTKSLFRHYRQKMSID